MLKRKLIPTPLIDPAKVPPIEIVPIKEIGRFQTLRLVFRLLRFLLSMTWARVLRHSTPLETAKRVREFLEDLGGLWIKAGQLVSLRTDLLSPEMVDELSQLAYRAFGFAPEVARQVVEESLGQPIEEVFDIFEDHPFAAASISQVHRGRLRHNGVWVAIKVQRPDITRVFTRDLKLVTWILRQMNRVPAVSYMTWDGMIRELQRIMQEEIDYRYEVANLRRLRKVLRRHKVYVPKVYRRYSGAKIIVMEFITGVLMSDYLRIERTDPARVEAWRKENKVKPRQLGSRLLRSFYRQLFEDNLFHGDLHPGNIVLLKNGRYALLDLGTLGNLEAKFVELYKQQAKAFSERDYSKAVDYYLLLADSIPTGDIVPFKTESVEVYRAWEARTHLQGMTYVQKSVTGGVASEASVIARKYKVNPTWQLLRVARALATLDANLSALLGEANPNKIMKKYFRQSQKRAWKRLRKRGIRRAAGDVFNEIKLSANFVSDKVRQEAIRFQGVQSKIDFFFERLFGIVRLALFAGGIVALYDFLHQHHYGLIRGLHARIGAFARIAESIPPYPYEFGVVVLIVTLYLFIVVGRVKRRYAEETVRLPGGRLDT